MPTTALPITALPTAAAGWCGPVLHGQDTAARVAKSIDLAHAFQDAKRVHLLGQLPGRLLVQGILDDHADAIDHLHAGDEVQYRGVRLHCLCLEIIELIRQLLVAIIENS